MTGYWCTRCAYEYLGAFRCPIHGDAARAPSDQQVDMFPEVKPKPKIEEMSRGQLANSLCGMEPRGDGAWGAYADGDGDEWIDW